MDIIVDGRVSVLAVLILLGFLLIVFLNFPFRTSSITCITCWAKYSSAVCICWEICSGERRVNMALNLALLVRYHLEVPRLIIK